MHVSIETAHNVEIEYEIASIGDRIVARIIDSLIVGGYLIGMVLAFSNIGLFDSFVLIILLYLPVLLYHPLCEVFMDGQTFGKKAIDIKVVKMDGGQPSVGSYLLRWLLQFIDSLPFLGAIGIITILVNGKGQRLGDMAAGTTVISLKHRTGIKDTILSRPALVDTDYTPVYPQVSRLNDRDISIIKESLNRVKKGASRTILTVVAQKVREAMKIEMTAVADEVFLTTVIRDYNHIAGSE